MDTGKAIFYGLALIALAILVSDGLNTANANSDRAVRYHAATVNESRQVYIVDTQTGRYRRCSDRGGCTSWFNGAQTRSK